VLYDRSGQKLSLVNDPLLWNQFYGDGESTGQSSSQRRSTTSLCPHCGQYMSPPNALPLNFDEHTRVSGSDTPTTSSGTTVRDMDYFKLLEYIERKDGSVPIGGEPPPKPNGISDSALSQGYFDRFFVTRGLLGRGSRGAVYLVEHVLDGVSLGMFAVKKVAVGNDHVWLEKVLSEVQMLRMLTHSNLVGYNHVWLENSRLSQFGPEVPCAYILQEYCDGGTLEDYLEKRQADSVSPEHSMSKRERLRRLSSSQQSSSWKSAFDGKKDKLVQLSKLEIVSFMFDITRGVKHLHQNQIIHRDLKPSNCLLVNSKIAGQLPNVLVSDFGEGQLEGLHRSATGSTGTLEYCAPELVKADLDGGLAQFSKSTDIFSLGMIMHLLCFSKLPYSEAWWEERQDIDSLAEEVRNYRGFNGRETSNLRDDLSSNIYKLLSRTLAIDPLQRPSADEILMVLETEMGTRVEESTSRISEHLSAKDIVASSTKLVPTLAQSAVPLPLPSRMPSLYFFYYLNRRSKWLVLKLLLLAVETFSIYRLGLNGCSQILVLLLGIGIPM
jgi:serine/threonine protein kinase